MPEKSIFIEYFNARFGKIIVIAIVQQFAILMNPLPNILWVESDTFNQ